MTAFTPSRPHPDPSPEGEGLAFPTRLHGWLILDKPVGPGSTDAVTAVKRALRGGGYAKTKVGHGGTLDPLASGVLPVALGEATKLAGRLLDGDKIYAFTVAFGAETATLDAEGAVVAESAVRPTLAELHATLPRFTGAIRQMPPAYSALKVDGRRAYDLARAGEEVALAERAVVVRSLTVEEEGSPSTSSGRASHGNDEPSTHSARAEPVEASLSSFTTLDQATLVAHVSKGTYIRSLARDIARACGTVGHVTMLRRLRAGPFALAQAISLDKLAELATERRLEQALLPLAAGLDDISALRLPPEQARALAQGRVLSGFAAPDGPALAYDGDAPHPLALVEVETGMVRVARGFNLQE